MKDTKTQRAIDLMAKNPTMTRYAAAKKVGLAWSVLHRAIETRAKKLEGKQSCETDTPRAI